MAIITSQTWRIIGAQQNFPYDSAVYRNDQETAESCHSHLVRENEALSLDGGSVLCIHGEINKELAQEIISLPIKKDARVVLDSLGGDIVASLDIAEHLLAFNVSIIVNKYCMSSCANYIFMSGKKKAVLYGSFVGFHGGPSMNEKVVYHGPPEFYQSSMLYRKTYIQELLDRQSAFYLRIGVNSNLIYYPPPNTHVDLSSLEHTFWEFGPNVLREQFGVAGIEVFLTPDDLTLAKRALLRFDGLSCVKTEEEAWICHI